ncbi:uncharacterized protein EI90DRAFT_3059468 [Cantharellus anzutake]|uniref:uncharacterized protein n=1 Tax=Cantharellus anzutake TaxID=1750568 RepID=UPI001902F3AA|nr:uncharacterized protein EI90DRAFT_3059468 [Cantharellus anzutake]KAF8330838.1 hypothetical protein EI90DRAFT_3059468 [Cantharellus anzutake]
MSLRQKAEALRQTIDDLLVAGGDIAVPILRVVNATANWCPPLKMATGGALSILDEVKKFKENEKEWADFGQYVVDMVAEVILAIESYDTSAEEAKPWVENANKLGGALQKVKSEIERRLKKIERRATFINTLSYLKDPGRIDGLKKDFDKSLALFQLRTNLITSSKLAAIERRQQDDKILDSLRYPHVAHDDSTQACLKDTRVDLLERIMTWCHNTRDSENRLMLLTAVAGAGKTAIALTIAERCASDEDVTLLLHYFFKEGERSRPDFVFSGIARALADHDPVYRTFITSALRKDPSLSTTSFTMQFKKLSLAEILGEEVPKLPSSVKFFLTSRQFDLVNRYLSPDYPIYRLTINLSDETNVQDCAKYICFQLQKLKKLHRDYANGLFIWISTIFRYMKMANKDPMRTLESLLDTGAKRPDVPAEKMMDDLYTSILKKCAWDDEDFADDYPIMMGAIFLAQQPLSITAWDAILSPSLKSSVRYMLAELAPLLSGVEDSHIPIRILHQSLRDFVVDRIDSQTISSCCSPVNVGTENARVALRCTEILNEELCSIKGLGLIENLSKSDEMPPIAPKELSEHFQYACRYIVHHLSGVQEPSQQLSGSVGMFLSQQATRWVEVCVRMGSYVSILSLPEWAKLAVDHRSKGSVSMLANALAELPWNLIFLSRFQEACEAANDSVVLCRYLFSVDSGFYTAHLARSLNSLYFALSNIGQHSEALPFVEESIKLYRSYTQHLATSLSNLHKALSKLGRHSEALPFIKESVKLRRQLVAVHPGSYTPVLAMSLSSLYSALSDLGQHSEALPFIKESVKLYHQLVAIHPGSYTPDLANSLNNLYLALSNLGWHSEALPFIEESVKFCHQLAAVHPGSYTPDLAMSLSNLCTAFSKLGHHSEALPFIEESVKLCRQLVAVNPGSYTPYLASSLNNLYLALSNLGRHSEALPFIEESVKFYRQLVTIHPGSYTPKLAISLSNLFAVHPGSYTPGLASSLNNLCLALSKLGRHSEALPFIEECVKLRRQLVAVNPGAYTPRLAKSLKHLRNALSNLDRHSEAQMVHI